MNLKEFLALDEEHTIASHETQSLNSDLASTLAENIPNSRRARVADYLVTALNMESVDDDVRPNLELLLGELQAKLRFA